MCGLAGAMSSTLSNHEVGVFRGLLNIASFRGTQGSGVIVNQREKSQNTVRSLRTVGISGHLAYGSEKFDELVKLRVNTLIGHARFPTKGGVDLKACHPHRSEHIIGVHNGTMWKVGGEDVKDQSDSKMLFESFAKNGVIETIKESEGAYALVWIDEKDQTINFLRNGQRTLFFKNFGWSSNINTLYWSSEKEMLDFVCGREYKYNASAWDTFMPIDKWIKYPLEVTHIIKACEVIEDVKPKPKVYPVVPFRGHGGRGTNNTGHEDTPWHGARTSMRQHYLDEDAQVPVLKDGILCAWDQDKKMYVPMSKNAQKRWERKQAKHEREEAARQRRLEQFRNANQGKEPPRSAEEALRQLLDEQLAAPLPSYDKPSFKFEGKCCAFCGDAASVGDTIFPVGFSAREFVCSGCADHADEFIDRRSATVVNF
jgi:hypothetical protein